MSVVNITKENYQSVVSANQTVLLDFWAVWCGPCKMIAPIVAEIAEERHDVVVGKVDVDSEMELAMQFGISSIPTLVVIRNGVPAVKSVGYRPKADIEKLLDA
ncbi:MAG: thioredoxin [Oscillospiraceae bacterium]|nr:thioredoxin [Oscillospiraceae bacterium]